MNTFNEFLKLVIGQLTPATFLFCMLLAAGGAFVKMTLLDARKAKIQNLDYSPNKFSWAYWYNDNTKRIVANAIVIYLFIRFMPELTLWMGFEIPAYFQIPASFFVGMGIDKLVNKLKKNGLLKNDPDKNPARIDPENTNGGEK